DRLSLGPGFGNQPRENFRADSPSLPRRGHVQLPEIERSVSLSRLDPADIAAIGDDDAYLLDPELLGELPVLSFSIPSEEAFDDPAHRLEIDLLRKPVVIEPCCSKSSDHER